MSVTIRLTKTGKKNAPSFRIAVCPTRSKRDGKPLALIGFYNPSNNPVLFEYDKNKYNEWVKKGAKPSDAVKNLIDGKYNFVKYEPNKKPEKFPKGEKNAKNEETSKGENSISESVESESAQ